MLKDFLLDVLDKFNRMGELPDGVFKRKKKKRRRVEYRGPTVRHMGQLVRLSREQVIARFVGFCLDRKEPMHIADESHMVLVFSGAAEDWISELEPWHRPYQSRYRDVLYDHAEKNGYFYDKLVVPVPNVDTGRRGDMRNTA